MKIFDVERIPTHGGSVRIYIAKIDAQHTISPYVNQLAVLEKQQKLHSLKTYQQFAKRVEKNKLALMNLLKRIKKSNKQIVGYGAPAKGNTLLNYFGITTKHLDYIADDSEFKQGLYTPGTHIPVVSPNKLTHPLPDYILILAWNFANALIEKYALLQKKGVKFIVSVPEPRII